MKKDKKKEKEFMDRWRWVKCSLLILYDRRLKLEDKVLYLYLSGYAGRGDIAYPSYDRIRREIGLSRNAIAKSLKILEGFGLISILAGSQNRNRYRLHSIYEAYGAEDDVGSLKPEVLFSLKARGMDSYYGNKLSNVEEDTEDERYDFQNPTDKPDDESLIKGHMALLRKCQPDNLPESNVDKLEALWVGKVREKWPDITSLHKRWKEYQKTMVETLLHEHGYGLIEKLIVSVIDNWENYKARNKKIYSDFPNISLVFYAAPSWIPPIESGHQVSENQKGEYNDNSKRTKEYF